MALIGGGGAGNVAGGSNPSGTGQGLNYLGNHAYANSGAVTNATTYHNILKFDLGSQYIVGAFTLNGSVVAATVGAGNINVYQITVNSEVIALVKFDSQTEAMPQTAQVAVILAPYDHVEVSVKADDTNGADTALFSGRVYG